MHRLIWWLIILIVILGAIWGLAKVASAPVSDGDVINGDELKIRPNDWTKGNKEAKIVLIEYSDFQCPACATYWPVLKQLVIGFGDRIIFVYRHFPLKQIHKNAELAARSAEAAGKQGKFWEMHDLLFDQQSVWSAKLSAQGVFESYAEELGLDVSQFKKDLDSMAVKTKVELDYQSGIDLGVNATPTFYLDSKKLTNPRSYDEFKKIVEESLNQ